MDQTAILGNGVSAVARTQTFVRLTQQSSQYGHEIECPLHQGKFDVRDGRATCAPASENIKTYPVKIENSRVFVKLI
jgi:nitrite reductase/ring-hydroxylating ferredoxin subunit